jgi:hypothetical protein
MAMRLTRPAAAALLVAGLALEALGLWVLIRRPDGWPPVLGVALAFVGLAGIALGFGALAGGLLGRRLGRIPLDVHAPGDPNAPLTRTQSVMQIVLVVTQGLVALAFLVLAVQSSGFYWFMFALFFLLFCARLWLFRMLARARRRAAEATPPPE